MTPKDDKNIPVPAPEDDYSLEEILAEYGGSLEHHLLRETEAPADPEPPAAPAEPAPAQEPETPPVPEPPPVGDIQPGHVRRRRPLGLLEGVRGGRSGRGLRRRAWPG